jgi:hypothetical protein
VGGVPTGNRRTVPNPRNRLQRFNDTHVSGNSFVRKTTCAGGKTTGTFVGVCVRALVGQTAGFGVTTTFVTGCGAGQFCFHAGGEDLHPVRMRIPYATKITDLNIAPFCGSPKPTQDVSLKIKLMERGCCEAQPRQPRNQAIFEIYFRGC